MSELPRVTYSNIAQDMSGVHARLDEAIRDFEASALGRPLQSRVARVDRPPENEHPVRSPIDDRLLLARASVASTATLDAAVRAARDARSAWGGMPWRERVAAVLRVADVLEARKWSFAVAALLEVGKSRMEAIGEVEESIDLIRYYCAELDAHDGFHQPLQRAFQNEATEVVLRPHGVFAVIAPFNYPVALATGMITGALLGGNTVVFKPSPTAALTGRMLVEAFDDAGIGAGALNLVCGGAATGRALANDPRVDGIVFTGSHQVGMQLLRERAMGAHAKPVIAEMGGKNPVYVCASAALDDAVEGVARSAYGLQGQKCSSASRAFVHADVYDAFVERLAARAERMSVGDPREPATFVGPLLDARAFDRYAEAVREASADGAVRTGGRRREGGVFDHGFYVEPTLVTDLPAGHRLHADELFLPFLTVRRFTRLDEALAEGNAVNYGLTAGIYTSVEAELRRFLDDAQAGVLYANRESGATTGAWPGIQTFCGWKGSGTTGKGGLGPHYLAQFMREQSRTVVPPGKHQR